MNLEHESKPYSKQQRAEIMAFYKEQLKLVEQSKARLRCVRKFGIHYSTIRTWVKKEIIREKYKEKIGC
jgi:hypothetical protein